MDSKIVFSRMKPERGQEVSELSGQCVESGAIGLVWKYRFDAYQAYLALNPNTVGVVAKLRDNGKIVGSSIIDFGKVGLENKIYDRAFFNFLRVHPAYRRRGAASGMAKWKLNFVKKRVGAEVAIIARVQRDNKPSLAIIAKRNHQTLDNLTTNIFNATDKPPANKRDVRIETARAENFDEIAEKLNAFYRNHVFFVPQTGASLRQNIGQTPLGEPLRRCLVAKSKDGNILAGLTATKEYSWRVMEVRRMSPAINWLNKIVRLIPKDGELRRLIIGDFWFAPGQIEAARLLWENARWKWSGECNVLSVSFDKRSPLASICKLPFYVPQNKFKLVVKAPVPIDKNRLIFPTV